MPLAGLLGVLKADSATLSFNESSPVAASFPSSRAFALAPAASTASKLRVTPSHRRCKAILAVVHARRLKCAIRQLFRGNDENLDPRLQVSLVAGHEGDNRDTRRDDDLLLTVLVFDR